MIVLDSWEPLSCLLLHWYSWAGPSQLCSLLWVMLRIDKRRKLLQLGREKGSMSPGYHGAHWRKDGCHCQSIDSKRRRWETLHADLDCCRMADIRSELDVRSDTKQPVLSEAPFCTVPGGLEATLAIAGPVSSPFHLPVSCIPALFSWGHSPEYRSVCFIPLLEHVCLT